MTRSSSLRWLVVWTILVLLLSGCGVGSSPPTTLRVLASAELADLGPLLEDASRETGVDLRLDTSGPVDASIALEPGRYGHDLAWLSTDAYFQLKLAATRGQISPPPSTRIMLSPTVVGVTADVAEHLRARGGPISWASLADSAARGELRYAIGDPHRTASGLAALVGVATAAAGTGLALRPEDLTCDRLRGFAAGRRLVAGSGPDLVDGFIAHQGEVNGLVATEADIVRLNAGGRVSRPLEIVYPADGLVQSEYPLLLLDPTKQAAYERVVAWLRTPAVQQRIVDLTSRRPIAPEVSLPPGLPVESQNSLYFPERLDVVTTLLRQYDDDTRGTERRVIFVLDYSTSMRGPRIEQVRAAFADLMGTGAASFDAFTPAERVTVARFGAQVMDVRDFTPAQPGGAEALRLFLSADPGFEATGIWSALDWAYATAAADRTPRPGEETSVVLMTDGENNAGISDGDLLARLAGLARPLPTTDVIPVGSADIAALRRVVTAAGGALSTADDESLRTVLGGSRGCG